ncbi:hypothetical protein [Lactococcus sp.]|uniref:hypothetical protein n=1 Tax=Lactococcus sp. TaxID=44273 RepID=UPI002FCBE5FC
MVPQLIKAELPANFRIKLTFDNNEIRFLGTRNSKKFVEENTVLKNLFVAWGASLSSLSGSGQELEINKDGSLSVDNHILSSDKVYQLSVSNLSELTL